MASEQLRAGEEFFAKNSSWHRVGSQENLADVAKFWNIDADAIRGSNPGLALTNQEVVGGMILLIPSPAPPAPRSRPAKAT